LQLICCRLPQEAGVFPNPSRRSPSPSQVRHHGAPPPSATVQASLTNHPHLQPEINLVSAMTSDPPPAAIHASDPPASKPALAVVSQPLLLASTSALVAPATGLSSGVHGTTHVMTNKQLTHGLLGILQRLEVLHDGQQALQQALLTVQPGLQQSLLPSSSPTAASLPGLPAPPPSAAAPAVQPSSGVPIHMISFPPSPLLIPSWMFGPPPSTPPIYSSTTPITTVMLPFSTATTARTASGGIPVSATLYEGVDGPLFLAIPGSSMAVPPQDRTSQAPMPAPDGDRPPPKFYKLEFTTYDGSEDLLNWLSHCEQFFRGQRTLASDRTWLASYHLHGLAHTWYYTLEQSEGMPSWERFKELCHLQFGPPVCDSRLAELGRLPFWTMVQYFAERFNAILCHVRNLDNLQKVELFVGGLSDHIRVDVAMRAPQDLPMALYLARAFELRANAMLAMTPVAPPRPARPVQQRPQQPVPVLPVGGAGPPAAATPPAPRPFRRLTPAEQQERRRQGLCYNCDEPYVRGHQCKCVFYLEARGLHQRHQHSH
jgi:hypothetical protein